MDTRRILGNLGIIEVPADANGYDIFEQLTLSKHAAIFSGIDLQVLAQQLANKITSKELGNMGLLLRNSGSMLAYTASINAMGNLLIEIV